MAYSASALSFMLENLTKTVVFTGAMLPLGEIFNDAVHNLTTSMFVAAQAKIPEVVIFFCSSILRANRATKMDSWALDGFGSPNFPSLGHVGINLTVNRNLVRTASAYQ